jgi:hypothetical protein
MDHELNGDHDVATVECLALGEQEDRWKVRHKASAVEGILTISHTDDNEFNGWDWDQTALVEEDGTASEALQEILDCFGEYYN